MKNIKSFFRTFKEAWDNPRLRAIITLGFYVVFFLFVFIYIFVMESIGQNSGIKSLQEADPFMAYQSMKSYEYTYDITSTDGVNSLNHKILGVHTENLDSFSINNYKFYIQDNVIYSKIEGVQITDILPIDLMMLTPSNLSNYFVNDYLTNKTTYENGDMKAEFSIPVYNFNIAFLQGTLLDNPNYVIITVYIEDNHIQRLSINLDELMKLVDVTIQNYTIDITYNNINNIKSVEEF